MITLLLVLVQLHRLEVCAFPDKYLTVDRLAADGSGATGGDDVVVVKTIDDEIPLFVDAIWRRVPAHLRLRLPFARVGRSGIVRALVPQRGQNILSDRRLVRVVHEDEHILSIIGCVHASLFDFPTANFEFDCQVYGRAVLSRAVRRVQELEPPFAC